MQIVEIPILRYNPATYVLNYVFINKEYMVLPGMMDN